MKAFIPFAVLIFLLFRHFLGNRREHREKTALDMQEERYVHGEINL